MGSWKRMVVLTLASSALGVAVAGGPVAAQQRPCMDDLKKLCPNVKQGSGEALKCLQEHKDSLSEPCKKRLAKAEARGPKSGKTRDVCKSDIEKFCKDVQHGQGRMKECLQQHESDLSSDCKTALAAKRAKKTPGGSKSE